MHQVQLADPLYQEARRRATEAGFATVDEYVADIIAQDLELSTENLDPVFTPEVIRDLDRVSAAAKAGGTTYSPDQIREHFRKRSEAWREDHANREH
jgi:hypothetical protein